MNLYFSPGDNYALDDPANIFEDAGFTVPHGGLPSSADNLDISFLGAGAVLSISGSTVWACLALTNDPGVSIVMNDDAFWNAGSCPCNITLTTTGNTINGGTFAGNVTFTSGGGQINGGTFNGPVTFNAGGFGYALITGGTFNALVQMQEYSQSIAGGTFNGQISSVGNITGGIFNSSTIDAGLHNMGGGTFNNCIMNLSGVLVAGGTYYYVGTVAFNDLISGGLCTYNLGSPGYANPGFGVGVNGGTYSQNVTVTGIPVPSDILGSGLL